ncbi:MAG: isopenicillin N synthase family oxygenase [Proteobacteria bacterium]|nr:isopenicillin N synthase family oxygenase [Pseudomonadota bacterium]
MDRIPAIDIADFYSADEPARRAIGQAIGRACEGIGFLQVVGHRVPAALIDDVRAVSLAFFDLPPEEKQRCRPPAGVLLRGYTPPETNTLSRSRRIETPPDFREILSAGSAQVTGAEYPSYPGARMFYNPNIWPERPAGLVPLFSAYVRAMEELSRDLMRLFALGLDLPETYFDAKIDHHFGVFHSLHYAARRDPPQPGQLRAGAHSDFGSLTIIYPPAGGDGLEVLSPAGPWVAVDPVPGAFVINIGDLMQRWTNDRWTSTLHRVVNPSDTSGWRERRLSLGFFCHPNYDAPVACLPSCLAPDARPKYDDILAGEYMRQKIMAVRHVAE